MAKTIFLVKRPHCFYDTVQHNYSLAFVAGLKRATDEGSLPEIAQYSPYYEGDPRSNAN